MTGLNFTSYDFQFSTLNLRSQFVTSSLDTHLESAGIIPPPSPLPVSRQ